MRKLILAAVLALSACGGEEAPQIQVVHDTEVYTQGEMTCTDTGDSLICRACQNLNGIELCTICTKVFGVQVCQVNITAKQGCVFDGNSFNNETLSGRVYVACP